jgi:CRP-like cAMP-binding protein
MTTNGYQNKLLQHMPADVIARLRLQRIQLPTRHEIEAPGETILNLIFLEEGIASMTTLFEDGVQVETSMFGYESVIGVSALMGTRKSLNGIFMQLGGYGYGCTVQAAKEEFERNGVFEHLALRYVQAQLTLSTQNAACNATHTYEQRLARWLLICADRARQDTLDLAQDFIAAMLGSTRSTVSIAAAHLKAKNLIDYRRGSIVLVNKAELEVQACECYRVVRHHLEASSEFDTGFTT